MTCERCKRPMQFAADAGDYWCPHCHHRAAAEIEPGNAPSAPLRPRIALKFVVTTVVATIVFAGVYAVMEYRLIDWDSIPFLPRFER